MAGSKRNPGYCPPEAKGKRVDVTLANGNECKGWAADGSSGCRWSISGSDFDIERYQVAA